MTNIVVRDMYKRFHVFAIHVSVEEMVVVVEQDDITVHQRRNGRIGSNNFTVRQKTNKVGGGKGQK